jgi:hypothetical protein
VYLDERELRLPDSKTGAKTEVDPENETAG